MDINKFIRKYFRTFCKFFIQKGKNKCQKCIFYLLKFYYLNLITSCYYDRNETFKIFQSKALFKMLKLFKE